MPSALKHSCTHGLQANDGVGAALDETALHRFLVIKFISKCGAAQ